MKNRRDLLVLCQFFYPEYISSATLPTEMAEDLVADGYTVDVLCGYPKEYFAKSDKIKRHEVYRGIKIRRIPYLQIKRSSKIGRLINYFSFMTSVFLRFFSIVNYKCIIVYSNPPVLPLIPALIRNIFGTKFIFVAYDVYPDLAVLLGSIKRGSLIERLMKYTNRLVFRFASRIVVLGSEMKDYLLEHGISSRPEEIEIIPNWYDKDKIKWSNESMESSLLSKDGFTVVYSGNMGICQDMDTIMKCICRLKDNNRIQFILCGHGNKVEDVKAYIKEKSLSNVSVKGYLLDKEYIDLLKKADCYLVSLERGVEGLSVPSKTYSYMAVGRPIIAIMSSNTDIANVLSSWNAGVTVSQGDVDGLLSVIVNLSESPNKCLKMGENALSAFNALFERKICTKKYSELIRDTIKE